MTNDVHLLPLSAVFGLSAVILTWFVCLERMSRSTWVSEVSVRA